jgi:hypothetical protein
MLWELLKTKQELAALVVGIIAVILFHLYRTYSRLRQIPGPFIAKFTNFYRFFLARRGFLHLYLDLAHQRYGPAVRFGPNLVCICDPEAIPTIFNLRGGFPKACNIHLRQHVSLPMCGCEGSSFQNRAICTVPSDHIPPTVYSSPSSRQQMTRRIDR